MRTFGVILVFRYVKDIRLLRQSRQTRFFLSRKRPILRHTCGTVSELQSNTSRMPNWQYEFTRQHPGLRIRIRVKEKKAASGSGLNIKIQNLYKTKFVRNNVLTNILIYIIITFIMEEKGKRWILLSVFEGRFRIKFFRRSDPGQLQPDPKSKKSRVAAMHFLYLLKNYGGFSNHSACSVKKRKNKNRFWIQKTVQSTFAVEKAGPSSCTVYRTRIYFCTALVKVKVLRFIMIIHEWMHGTYMRW